MDMYKGRSFIIHGWGYNKQYSPTTSDEYLLKKRRLSNKDFDILTNCKEEAGASKVKGQSSWIVQDPKRMFQLHLQEYNFFEYDIDNKFLCIKQYQDQTNGPMEKFPGDADMGSPLIMQGNGKHGPEQTLVGIYLEQTDKQV